LATTTTPAPSPAFNKWMSTLEQAAEERLLHMTRRRFTSSTGDNSLHEFRHWLNLASHRADEVTMQQMRNAQLRAWLMVVARRRSHACGGGFHDSPLISGGVTLPLVVDGCILGAPSPETLHLPNEVRDCIHVFIGGRHVWGPIDASRARQISDAAKRPWLRCEEILKAAALAALVAKYVHPMVVQAAEGGHTNCNAEIPTDDFALKSMVEGSGAETHEEIGTLIAAHLAIDGFQVELRYHDPEYGLWRGFWVERCNRLRLALMW